MERKQVITITVGSDSAGVNSVGNLNAAEVFLALSMECQRLLTLLAQNNTRRIVVPGMLTPDLKRLPADVARRLINN